MLLLIFFGSRAEPGIDGALFALIGFLFLCLFLLFMLFRMTEASPLVHESSTKLVRINFMRVVDVSGCGWVAVLVLPWASIGTNTQNRNTIVQNSLHKLAQVSHECFSAV